MEGTITEKQFRETYLKDYEYVAVDTKKLFKEYFDEEDLPKNYEIEVTVFRCQDKEKHYWNVLLIEIKKDGQPYMSFGRDYSDIDEDQIKYVKQRGDDGVLREFLITTSQYMHTTIINLTDKTMKSYAIGDAEKGYAFCPIKFDFFSYDLDGRDRNELEIYGCYWAAPYGTHTIKDIDFTKDLTEKFNNTEYEWEDCDDEYEDIEVEEVGEEENHDCMSEM